MLGPYAHANVEAMGRIQRPLDSAAVRQADDEIYARHANDPRPNALYDAQGNRRPLDPVDPSQAALRAEWCALYEAALAGADAPSGGPGTGTVPSEPEPPPTNRPVDGPVEPCPNAHWLDVTLRIAPEPGARPAWWPVERRTGYASEHVSTSAPAQSPLRQLDANGHVRWDGIPAGAYDVVFWKFYHEVDVLLAREIG